VISAGQEVLKTQDNAIAFASLTSSSTGKMKGASHDSFTRDPIIYPYLYIDLLSRLFSRFALKRKTSLPINSCKVSAKVYHEKRRNRWIYIFRDNPPEGKCVVLKMAGRPLYLSARQSVE
jgi:hypothetical protein